MTIMDSRDELLAIERRLWANDAQFYRAALLPEAVLTFGETGVIDRETAVAAIERENADGRRWAEVELSDVRWLTLTREAIALTYRVSARWAHEDSSMSALATSAYVKRDGAWKLAFHQQTPLATAQTVLARSAAGERLAPIRAAASGAVAAGAFAVGAAAVGALAIGRLAVGALALKRARIRTLTVDELTIGRLRVRESAVPGFGDRSVS